MVNTFCQIGKMLQEKENLLANHAEVGIYVKRFRAHSKKDFSQSTYAFALTNHDIFICLSAKENKENFLGQGSTRLATKAIKINLHKDARLNSLEEVVRLKAHTSEPIKICESNQNLRKELEITTQLNKNCSAIVQPFYALVSPKKTSLLKEVAFQKLYLSSDRLFHPTYAVHKKIGSLINVAEGLQYLHKEKKIHCDIKRENLFLERKENDSNLQRIIADFGGVVNENELIKTVTVAYLAPEALDMQFAENTKITWQALSIPATPALDCFSFGNLLLKCLDSNKSKQEPLGIQMKKINKKKQPTHF